MEMNCCHTSVPRQRRLHGRRGAILADVLAAMFGVAAVSIVCLTMALTGTAARRQQLARQTALLEAENILQRLVALDPGELNGQAADLRLPEELHQHLEKRLQQRLPGAQLEIDARAVPAPAAGRQFSVAVRVPSRSPAMGAVVRLSTWVYTTQESVP